MSSERTTVLIVEDEHDLADLYAEWVEMSGYRTRTAYDGASALEQLDEEVDIALLDRRLPEMQGGEILDRIRGEGHDCSVAMVTAVEPEADIVEMGFDEYLVKPVERSELAELLEELSERLPAGIDDPTLDALGDPKARRCFYELQNAPKSARELAGATGYSRTTVYRRLNALRQAGLITSRTTIDPDGDHYETFVTETDLILVELDDGFRIEMNPEAVDRTDS
ncbi:response regulator [Natronomonas marina]|jgi:two-component system response regulator AdeR|uniref:response regulator n=1 Tax=Natronomonas marina TaxID=2961939 RepID=UPI0020C94467|nr:response regulator [Natronomonas marina]